MMYSQSNFGTAASVLAIAASLLVGACVPEDGDGSGESIDLPMLSIGDAEFVEGDDGAQEVTVPVMLTGLNLSNAVVDYRLVDMTAEGGSDFLAIKNGKLLFTPSDKQKDITVTIIGDDLNEEDEAFAIELVNPRNVELVNTTAVISLLNDDEASDPLGMPDSGYVSPMSYPGRTLLWSDEFNDGELDGNRWTHEIGTGNNGWGNNELQYYREENTFMHEGTLVIEAREERFGGSDYTSSRLITKDKQEFQYGRVDIRAALPEGQGLWPALWMLGADIDDVGWPVCGEIDVMELVGNDMRRVHGTAHFGSSVARRRFIGDSRALGSGESYADNFHVYSIEWEENRIRWFVDDELYHELTPNMLQGEAWPFNDEFFMIFNVAVGGDWPGSPDPTTIFPQRMFVDYIRVFQ